VTDPAGADPRLLRLSAALLVEQAVRSRSRPAELMRELVDGTARVHGHEIAFLCLRRGAGYRLSAASSVAQIDRTGPLARWVEALARRLQPPRGDMAVRLPSDAEIARPDADWAGGLPSCWMWLPLPAPNGAVEGVLVLTRRSPWQDADRLLAEPLAGCYGHALWAIRNRLPDFPRAGRRHALAAAAAVALLALIPVRLDTLAPAEVAAADPIPITAPFDGIVADVAVQPYQAVLEGDALLSFDARELAMKRDVAAKTLDVAEAELASLRNQAFMDPDSKNKILAAEQRVAVERETLAYAEDRFRRHRLTAPEAGVVLFDDRLSWKGRPVSTGQSLMTVAHPDRLELRIDVPVAGLIPSHAGADVRLFLDMDPSQPVSARLSRLGYEARPIPGGALAYRFVAAFEGDVRALQLGARGTAKVYGDSVSLGYYLLRRPWAAVRQFLGV
jgi:hypothetical protein